MLRIHQQLCPVLATQPAWENYGAQKGASRAFLTLRGCVFLSPRTPLLSFGTSLGPFLILTCRLTNL